MARRLAASLSLLVFATCLVAGLQADNPLATVLSRALLAMAGTLVIALIVGTMAQRMIDENVQRKEQELREAAAAGATEAPPTPGPASHAPRGGR